MGWGKGILLWGVVCANVLSGCPSSYTLGFPGPYPTQKFETTVDKDLHITVFYPDASPHLTDLPVIVFSAGYNQPRGSYEGYGTQLAQWGYIAVIRSYPSLYIPGFSEGPNGEDRAMVDMHAYQSSRLVDWCAEQNLRPESPLYGMVDANTVGTTGHSFGAAVALDTVVLDPRVKACVSIDVTWKGDLFTRTDELGLLETPVLYLASTHGSRCAKPPRATERLYDYTNPPTEEVTIVGADHMDFEDSIVSVDWFGTVFCPRGTADPQAVRDITTRYLVSWFNVYLKHMPDFKAYYAGVMSEQDELAGAVHIRRNLGNER